MRWQPLVIAALIGHASRGISFGEVVIVWAVAAVVLWTM